MFGNQAQTEKRKIPNVSLKSRIKIQMLFFLDTVHYSLIIDSILRQQASRHQCGKANSTRFSFFFFFYLINYLFIYLFMAVLGLRFCARAFSSCGKWGPLFIAVRGPLTVTASPVAEHRLQTRRLSNCGLRA